MIWGLNKPDSYKATDIRVCKRLGNHQEIRESRSLYVHIYMFILFYLFLHSVQSNKFFLTDLYDL